MDAWVASVLSVLDARNIRQAHFAGHSLGTQVVQQLGARAPDRVKSMSLLGLSLPPVEARRQATRDRAAKVRVEGMDAVTETIIQAALSRSTIANKPEVVALVRELLTRQDPEGYALCCEVLASSTTPELGHLEAPVLLLAGRDDPVSTTELSQKFADGLKSARVETISECGHWLTIEQPQAVTSAMRKFLSNVN
jgi:pimeloyl-ACP methyl ester carboxylesterase